MNKNMEQKSKIEKLQSLKKKIIELDYGSIFESIDKQFNAHRNFGIVELSDLIQYRIEVEYLLGLYDRDKICLQLLQDEIGMNLFNLDGFLS